jgi:hypothetical protein|tara:strand:- start:371 stop:586 length:216 start_codon:yes stop_codon:yes gene_type:complete
MTMLLTLYKSKKELKESIGKPLEYEETSMFGPEYKSTGKFIAAHRPAVTGIGGREFFAEITMTNDIITGVS